MPQNTALPELVTVPCLSDNYAYLVHHAGQTALIDAPEARPILDALRSRGWTLDQIALTHHHDDHVQGVAELVAATGAKTLGAKADAHRLPPLDTAVSAGDTTRIAGLDADILDVSGHTLGHIAFYIKEAGFVFTGDSLMSMGCGRLFEGDAATMWQSLGRLAALPDDVLVCSGHDYCTVNAAFARSIEPDNAALQQRSEALRKGEASCAPASLGTEKATNPFLRAARLGAALGMENATPVEIFAELRRKRDVFTL